MGINDRQKRLFTTFPSRYDPGTFRALLFGCVEWQYGPDDGDWGTSSQGEGASLLLLWESFASTVAAQMEMSVETAAEWILSGKDMGHFFMCMNDDYLQFFRSLATPGLVVAAHSALDGSQIEFKKAGKALAAAFPEDEFLFRIVSNQLDEVVWVMKKR